MVLELSFGDLLCNGNKLHLKHIDLLLALLDFKSSQSFLFSNPDDLFLSNLLLFSIQSSREIGFHSFSFFFPFQSLFHHKLSLHMNPINHFLSSCQKNYSLLLTSLFVFNFILLFPLNKYLDLGINALFILVKF